MVFLKIVFLSEKSLNDWSRTSGHWNFCRRVLFGPCHTSNFHTVQVKIRGGQFVWSAGHFIIFFALRAIIFKKTRAEIYNITVMLWKTYVAVRTKGLSGPYFTHLWFRFLEPLSQFVILESVFPKRPLGRGLKLKLNREPHSKKRPSDNPGCLPKQKAYSTFYITCPNHFK